MKINLRNVLIIVLIILSPLPKIQAEENPITNARSVYLIEYETKRVLYEKQAHIRIPMASTTKIMTAMLVLEKANLDDIVTVSKRAATVGGSTMHLKKGEELTVNTLLYGLLLRSGNDAAIALAEHVSGSVESFCELMNEKAKSLGACNTNFVTPHGLDNDDHYTTAHELALMTCEVLKNETFREIIATKSIKIDGRYLTNTNNLLYANNGIDGVKTGYTSKAGRCIIITAKRDGMRVVGVILGCDTKNKRTSDGLKISDYAFKNYAMYDIYAKDTIFSEITVNKGKTPLVKMVNSEQIRLPLTQDEYNSLKYEIKYTNGYSNFVNAPICKGEIIGELTITSNDMQLHQCPLYADSTSNKKVFSDYIKEIFINWLYPCE